MGTRSPKLGSWCIGVDVRIRQIAERLVGYGGRHRAEVVAAIERVIREEAGL